MSGGICRRRVFEPGTCIVTPSTEQILGIRFFNGTAAQAVTRMAEHGGLLVAPSGTCFDRFMTDGDYRRAIISADVVLPDSGAMVTLWRLLRHRPVQRISGLAYLHELFAGPALREHGSACWILPHERSLSRLLAWGRQNGFPVDPEECYLAPIYGQSVEDRPLLEFIEARQPRHVIVAIGAGAQERLGWFLRDQLSSRPAIMCIGGALGFITGDQVAIPRWADRFYLGWALRLLRSPRVFIPRLAKAAVLPGLIVRHGTDLPPLTR
jgi:UDP-N-acetyl-D-mannosaminuronic acid transferase (WecB/TagA/CpsF family)